MGEDQEMAEELRLYQLARETRFKIVGCEDVYTLIRIDGGYSICKDADGLTIHIAAWTPVEVV